MLRGGCPHAARAPAISPRGHLLACCGFELEGNPILDYGDGSTTPVAELMDRADEDVITNLIALVGPPQIATLLRERWPDEVELRSVYRSHCEACHDLVHIPRNRQALYRHQHRFARLLRDMRDRLEQLYRKDDGSLKLPEFVEVEVTQLG